eukprot:2863349-Pleurochrysis_carterae.AAC.2
MHAFVHETRVRKPYTNDSKCALVLKTFLRVREPDSTTGRALVTGKESNANKIRHVLAALS